MYTLFSSCQVTHTQSDFFYFAQDKIKLQNDIANTYTSIKGETTVLKGRNNLGQFSQIAYFPCDVYVSDI